MATTAAGRDQSSEATQKITPFHAKRPGKRILLSGLFYLFARPIENRGRKNRNQWRPLQGARERNKTYFLFCCVRQDKKKNKVFPLLFLPDPGELSKRKYRIPAHRGNKIAVLFRSRAWGGLYSVFGRLLPRDFQTVRFYITEPKKSRLFIGFRFHVPDLQASAESSLVFRVKQPLKKDIIRLLLRVQISRIPSLEQPGFGIIVYFRAYTFFLLPRGLYFFFSSASASA